MVEQSVIGFLQDNQNKSFRSKDIAANIGLSAESTSRNLKRLSKAGMVKIVKSEPFKGTYYKFNQED